MRATLHHIDAFTTTPFGGNPAGVVVLPSWPDSEVLAAIAAELNLSVTGFLVEARQDLELRLLTPTAEIGPAGHATMAAAYVALSELRPDASLATFHLRGFEPLTAEREHGRIALNYPAMPGTPCDPPEALLRGLSISPRDVLVAPFGYVAVVDDASTVLGLAPDMTELLRLDRGSAIVTAPGAECDFVSRVFSPKLGLPEDPVCGTAHRIMVPYWAERLKKSDLRAIQVSRRRGDFWCRDEEKRTVLAGNCAPLFKAELEIPDRVR
jgi:PhzF family phenazine biosynthesis protein